MNDDTELQEILSRAKVTLPWVPVGHPHYKWVQGADVQRTWRKYGWTPPSEARRPVYDEPKVPVWMRPEMRRVK